MRNLLLLQVKLDAIFISMKLNNYIKQRRGMASELARQIGVAPVLVSQWAKGQRPVPAHRCVAIERATDGAVTRSDLRPNDWRDLWPELAGKEGGHA